MMMSSSNIIEAEKCCDSCGIAEVDDIKLKDCDDCDLVKYCSDACLELHRSEHEAKCKERAAELRDEFLFRQPESSHHGDCPICCLPLPAQDDKSSFYPCCSKVICNGCSHANKGRQREQNIQRTCPFCRHPLPKNNEEAGKISMKRVEANDPVAMVHFGYILADKGDYDGAFKYFTKAAEFGDADADTHYILSFMYMKQKDEKKELYHLEEAAILGHPDARHKIGCIEALNDKIERAVKHFTIAANLGQHESMRALKDCYQAGLVSKDDFAATLRAHHAAVNATKSPQRDAAEKANLGQNGLVLGD